jgi:hypothetical protein
METKNYFWFSEKQLRRILSRTEHRTRNYAKINGQIVEYTMWTNTKEHNATWDDVIYLGEGKYDHSEEQDTGYKQINRTVR